MEEDDDLESEEENFDHPLPKVKFGLVSSSDKQTPRPVSATSSVSITSYRFIKLILDRSPN